MPMLCAPHAVADLLQLLLAPIRQPGHPPRSGWHAGDLLAGGVLPLLVRSGAVRDYAALARLGQVSRARITQIMSLLYLAPDLQETILFLPGVQSGRGRIHLHELQALTALLDWQEQRRRWNAM